MSGDSDADLRRGSLPPKPGPAPLEAAACFGDAPVDACVEYVVVALTSPRSRRLGCRPCGDTDRDRCCDRPCDFDRVRDRDRDSEPRWRPLCLDLCAWAALASPMTASRAPPGLPLTLCRWGLLLCLVLCFFLCFLWWPCFLWRRCFLAPEG